MRLELGQMGRAAQIRSAVAKADRDYTGWSDAAILAVERVQADAEFTCEQLRTNALYEVGPVLDNRAWGAIIATAVRRGLIVSTGKKLRSDSKSAHRRNNRVWRRVWHP